MGSNFATLQIIFLCDAQPTQSSSITIRTQISIVFIKEPPLLFSEQGIQLGQEAVTTLAAIN